jgi:excisionase family DNA binding protein
VSSDVTLDSSPVTDEAGDDPGEVMTAREVSAFLGIGRRQVFEHAARGELPCRRLGRRLLFYRPRLVEWLSCKAASRERDR